MTLRLQWIIGILIVLFIFYLYNMVRKKKMDLRYAMIWILMASVVLVFDLFPQLAENISYLLGIDLVVNMMFFLGFLFALLIIFILSLSLSRLSDKVKCLSQEIALLKKEIAETKEEK